MNEQNGTGERRLTINDPVPAEVIQQFRQIQTAQADIGLEFLRLEQRKIQLLAASKKLDEQHQRIFQALLVERGVDPAMPAELDGQSGKLVLQVETRPAEPAPAS